MEIKQRRNAVTPRITLSDLAKASGISERGINKIENGQVRNPGIHTVTAIQDALTQLEAQRQASTTP